jgi:molybdopterin synthase catalytic subunit
MEIWIMKIDLNRIIQTLKEHPDYFKMGMIASHLGVVRGNSLNGQEVIGIEVKYDQKTIDKILSETKEMPGIIDVLVEISTGHLNVGDDIMAVVVGGDTREHVFPALMAAVNRIKKHGTKKKEFFITV